MSSIEAIISRCSPCTWYVSLNPSETTFQFASTGTVTTVSQRKSSNPIHSMSSGTASRYSASGIASGSRFTNTIAAPRVDLRREEREVVVAQRAEALPRRHLAQPARQVPRPAVVAAAQLGEPVADALAEQVAAVAAHVLERAQLAVVAADDQHRDTGRTRYS